MPLPELGEYYANKAYFDRIYSIPYYFAALIITILGCGIAPQIAKRVGGLPGRRFAISCGATLLLLLLVSTVSDVGGLLGLWHGPMILIGSFSDYDVYLMAILLAKAFLLPCILSGAVAIGESLFHRVISLLPHPSGLSTD